MILVDTSVWIEIFRNKTGRATKAFQEKIGVGYYVLTRFNQLELLQGARIELICLSAGEGKKRCAEQ